MKHFLEVDSVLLSFGTKRVLQDVYLKCETGRAIGILGRNGMGKSCLMNIMYGELKTHHQSVRLDGKVFLEAHRKPRQLMYLPQFSFIPKHLRLKRIFEDFELDFNGFINYFPEMKKYYNTKLSFLSGGESRIVEIYLILASKTQFCMLDEPFSQVMPVHVDTIKDLINTEKQNKGITITDHLYEHILEICDDVYVIVNGKTYLIRDKNDLLQLGYITKAGW